MKLEDLLMKKARKCFANFWYKKPANNNISGCSLRLVPDVTYNYKEFREPLVGEDN